MMYFSTKIPNRTISQFYNEYHTISRKFEKSVHEADRHNIGKYGNINLQNIVLLFI